MDTRAKLGASIEAAVGYARELDQCLAQCLALLSEYRVKQHGAKLVHDRLEGLRRDAYAQAGTVTMATHTLPGIMRAVRELPDPA